MAKYKAYPEYKDSGVEWLGEIPAHWQLKRLGTQFVERKDKVSDKNFPPLSVSKEGIVPQIETVAKTDAGDNRKLVMINDFVINSRSDRKGSSGVSKLNGSVSLISIVLQPQKIAPQYTHHLLRSSCFQEEFYRFGKGIVADLWSTNYSEMKNILIPIPPKNECNLISLFIDNELKRLHKLIAKLQNLIELLKEKRQALISHAVTKGLNPDVLMKDSGVEWLDKVPTHWLKTSIKYTTKLNPVKKSLESSLYQKCSFIPMEKLKLGRIILDKIKEVKEVYHAYTYFENDDILIAKVTPCFENKNFAIAKNLVNGLGFGSTEIYVLRCNSNISNEFVFYRLQESNFSTIAERAMTGAGGLKRVPSEVVSSFKYFLPSLIEQQEIASFLNSETKKIDTLIQKQLQQIDLLKERRTALIAAAVTGKIDLRDWTPPASSAEESPTAEEATA
jgi:type I restriction enzyme S subunit